MKDRIILHCDCNSFFASVELLTLPELKGQPVAVSGSVDERHGIILAKNEEAKKFGVQTAETVWQAKRKCPNLVLVPPHRERYEKFSKQINEIYDRYTDLVEPFSIDESYLDVTGSLHLFGGNAKALADEIRAVVQKETGLTISVGVSFNKIFAKLGSDYKKPNATTVISQENYKDILYPLPIRDLIFVGKAAEANLKAFGIHTIGDLAKKEREYLVQSFGKMGDTLWKYVNGLDDEPVRARGEARTIKSVGNGHTFKRDLVGPADLKAGVTTLADSVALRLRKHGLYCTGVQLTIKNPELKSVQRQVQLPATCLSEDLVKACMEILKKHWYMYDPVRLLTVTAIGLTNTPHQQQVSFFETEEESKEKQEHLEEALYKIKNKYGKHAIARGNVINNSIGISELEMKSDEETEGTEEFDDEK